MQQNTQMQASITSICRVLFSCSYYRIPKTEWSSDSLLKVYKLVLWHCLRTSELKQLKFQVMLHLWI